MPGSGHALAINYGFRSLPGLLLGIGYIVSIVAGFYGFYEHPPTSVAAVLGLGAAAAIWNLSFVIAGAVGLFARWKVAPRTEIIAVEMVAVLLSTWGVFVFLTPQSNQAGLALFVASLLMLGWASGTRRYLDSMKRAHPEKEE